MKKFVKIVQIGLNKFFLPLNIEIRRYDPKHSRSKPKEYIYSKVRNCASFGDYLSKIKDVQGDIVECGVGWGRSLFTLSALTDIFYTGRIIYAFDSFEGFPEEIHKKFKSEDFIANYDDVKKIEEKSNGRCNWY